MSAMIRPQISPFKDSSSNVSIMTGNDQLDDRNFVIFRGHRAPFETANASQRKSISHKSHPATFVATTGMDDAIN